MRPIEIEKNVDVFSYKGHDAQMVVPFLLTDSIPKDLPESWARSLMLLSPSPRHEFFEEKIQWFLSKNTGITLFTIQHSLTKLELRAGNY